ncbi:hypothetical protein [Caloranaerobacter sp. DY30410]|uniref:hypothetical protein n=1 Tax=Caloranaerobacter sp. DY30410 TaxID=3238305 RepID=UPI003D028009
MSISKEILLSYVDEIGNNRDFWNGNYGQGRNAKKVKAVIGSTNIRGLAVMALNTDCYREFRLFIEYKTSKGNGWDAIYKDKEKYKNGKKFGEVIIDYLDKIYEDCNKNDKEALKQISKFFGFLYWKKRIIGDK